MRTTINDVDRRGDARAVEDIEDTLANARKLLADTNALLQLEIERLFDEQRKTDDRIRADKIRDQISQMNKAIGNIVEIDVKAGLNALGERDAMNLEAARDEILGRLARLAARGGTERISE